jgi:6-phosphogluconolactonase
MRRSPALMLMLGFLGAGTALQAIAGDRAAVPIPSGGEDELVYVGTRDNPGAPASRPSDTGPQGIYAARLNKNTGRLSPQGLTVELQRTTWLVTHPTLPVIYSIADPEAGTGADSNIYSLQVDPASGKLQTINKVDSGGRDATALDLDAPSNTLIVASYRSGTVSALPVLADGSLGPVVSSQKDYGSGPHPRQKAPTAHGVAVDPTHKYVLVADFGADRIFVYHFDGKTRALTPAEPPFESLPPGSGPRHLVFHPNGRFLFLDTELTAELRTYHWDAQKGRLNLIQTLFPFPVDATEKSAAEVAVSHDGRFVYLSLRGNLDCIVVYAVNKRAGSLTEIQRISGQGREPWSFGVDPTGHWMLVTNQASNSVTELKIDPASGKLSATGESLSIPMPVTVAFYPK